MSYNTDNILSFAGMLIFGLQQDWGKLWTQREIDGFFFNQYENDNFQHALVHVRRRFLDQDLPPYPSRWNDLGADAVFSIPIGNGPIMRPELNHWVQWDIKGSDRHSSIMGGVLGKMAAKFCVQQHYMGHAFLHGTPVPFERFQIRSAYEWPAGVNPKEIVRWVDGHPVRKSIPITQRIPYFEVAVYSLPIAPWEIKVAKHYYKDFLETQELTLANKDRHDPSMATPEDVLLQTEGQMGSHIIVKLLEDVFPHLEIRSYPPFASPDMLTATINDALKQHRPRLLGSDSVLPTIRVWTVYLLSQKGGLPKRGAIRAAIKLWNDRLGRELGCVYNMEEGSVTSSGEIHFSNDRKKLKDRIVRYQAILTRRRT